MRDLDVQIREYFDEVTYPVTIEDVFFAAAEEEPVRPIERLRPVHRRRPWMTAAVAAAIIILGAIPLLMLRASESGRSVTTEPPATAPPLSSEEIARTFLEATTVADAVEAIALVAPGAAVDLGGIDDAALLEPWFAWNRAMGFVATATGCDQLSPTEVRCRYTYTNPWMEALEINPWAGSTMTFTVVDGRITSIEEFLSFTGFEGAWTLFKDWVERAYPGQLEMILTPEDRPILTESSIELWTAYSDQFTRSFAFLDAAEAAMDAFLANDEDTLRTRLGPIAAPGSLIDLMAWSDVLNYELMDRSPCTATTTTVTCVVTGRDDLMNAFGLVVTDTYEFAFTTLEGQSQILDVRWLPDGSLDDFAQWISEQFPEWYEIGGVCEGNFEGGPTPGACALAWLGAADEYLDSG